MGVKFKDNAFSTILIDIEHNTSEVVLEAETGSRFPTIMANDYFYATIFDATNIEIIKCVARNNEVLTIERGVDGTTPISWALGSKIELRLTSLGLSDIISLANALDFYDIPFNAGFNIFGETSSLSVRTYGSVLIGREITPQSVVASIVVIPSGRVIKFDVTSGGTSIFVSGSEPSVSETGVYTQGTLVSDLVLPRLSVIEFNVTQVGSIVAGSGLRIALLGTV